MEKKEFLINENNINKRLDSFLQEQFSDFSRAHIQNLINNSNVEIKRNKKILKNIEKNKNNINNNYQNLKNGEKLKLNDLIIVNFSEPEKIDLSPEKMNLNIVYQDDDLAVINKPQGLVVHPSQSTKSGTLVNGLLAELDNLSGINGKVRPGIVHRLDKDTAGLLVVAKNDNAHIKLSKQLENKTCKRIYLAIIDGRFKQPDGEITTYINRDKKDRTKMAVSDDGKLAVTKYKTLEFFKDYSLVEFELKTGRTHQIRVHCKYLHHPIIGDSVYGGSNKFKLKGQCLFAKQLEFVHPTTNQKMVFCAPLPDYFENVLNYLRKNNAEN